MYILHKCHCEQFLCLTFLKHKLFSKAMHLSYCIRAENSFNYFFNFAAQNMRLERNIFTVTPEHPHVHRGWIVPHVGIFFSVVFKIIIINLFVKFFFCQYFVFLTHIFPHVVLVPKTKNKTFASNLIDLLYSKMHRPLLCS